MRKILSFIPAMFLMILIFGFSAQNGEQSGGLSTAITHVIVDRILHLQTTPDEMALFEFAVRKIAHFSEYFLLALSLAFAFHVNGLRGKKSLFIIALWCFLYACTDEYHQSFVGGRSPQLRDVLIDTCGGVCGDILAHIISAGRFADRSAGH